MTPAIVALNPASLLNARRAVAALDGELHLLSARFDTSAEPDATPFEDVGTILRELFERGRPLVAFAAAGIVIRTLAPLLASKGTEPPVLSVSPDGRSIVPLLGGHQGANALAERLASALGGHAAVTTGGDAVLGVALDAPPAGWTLAAGNAKRVTAALLSGAPARVDDELAWAHHLRSAQGERTSADGALPPTVRLSASDAIDPPVGQGELVYRARRYVLGMGCERGAGADELIALAEATLRDASVAPGSLAAVCSLDVKADEAAIHAVAEHLGVPARFFAAATLEAERERLANPSAVVFQEVGCHGVAEGAALAAVGTQGELIAPKRKSARATAALAQAPQPLDPSTIGRGRGSLAIVGLGPGAPEWRSPEATSALRRASDWVGYSLYLDLADDVRGDRVRHDYPLGAEEARVRAAMELAGTGRDVALVCSGDAGIYAMATLAFELIDRGGVTDAARRIELAVCPGISALQAAAARAGAPLGHDFCTISLSDLLTPWPAIVRRVAAAAEGDFVIAFYNPVSRKRRTQLAHARDVLMRHRPPDTPVVLATNLGREGERVRIVSLRDLDVDEVDMLTVVIVGSSETRAVRTGDGRTWAYTPRGYGGKAGTGIAAGEGTAAA